MQSVERRALFAMFFVLPAVAPGCYLMGPAGARAAIEAGNATFSEAFSRGDSDAIAALYSEDAIVLPPGGAMVKGRPAIAEFWKATRQSGVTGAVLTTLEVDASGDLAHEVGTALLTIQPKGKKKPAKASVKYVVVWKRNGGVWQLHRDIWNDLPAPK